MGLFEIMEQKFNAIAPQVNAIEGHLMEGQDKMLFALVNYLPVDAVILEIGAFKGKSTVAMGYACLGTSRKIYCIDTFDGNDSDFHDRSFLEEWQCNIDCNGLSGIASPLQGISHDVLSNWQILTGGVAVDLVFIDGSHQFIDVLDDFRLAYPWLKTGGVCAFHDVIPPWPGPYRVWHDLASLVLEDHIIHLSLACGRKTGPMPRWAQFYLEKMMQQ